MSVTWEGLNEFRAQLRELPRRLAGEASHLMEAAANGAAVDIRTVYGQHRVTGHLQESVSVTQEATSAYGVIYLVKSSDPIAWLFDNGSQARHWARGKSTGAMWGKTPPTHAFVGTMMRARRRMYSTLADMMVREGLIVSGEF